MQKLNDVHDGQKIIFLARLSRLAEIIRERGELRINRWTNECGTAGCILGTAAMDAEFNQQGLYLDEHDGPAGRYPIFNTGQGYYSGREAGQEFFGVPGFLFSARTFAADSHHAQPIPQQMLLAAIVDGTVAELTERDLCPARLGEAA